MHYEKVKHQNFGNPGFSFNLFCASGTGVATANRTGDGACSGSKEEKRDKEEGIQEHEKKNTEKNTDGAKKKKTIRTWGTITEKNKDSKRKSY